MSYFLKYHKYVISLLDHSPTLPQLTTYHLLPIDYNTIFSSI